MRALRWLLFDDLFRDPRVTRRSAVIPTFPYFGLGSCQSEEAALGAMAFKEPGQRGIGRTGEDGPKSCGHFRWGS
jgi:hypothetical protein